MDAFERTTKQIASKYKNNLTYWYKPHYLRRWKLGLFMLAVVGSLFFAFKPHPPTLFSTGPLSGNHAHLANKCEECHIGTNPDLLSLLKPIPGQPDAGAHLEQTGQALLAELGLGKLQGGLKKTLQAATSLKELDQACYRCHDHYRFHQPHSATLVLLPFRREITGAQVTSCSNCHREHQGPERMPEPASTNCVDCHSQPHKLDETLVTFATRGKEPPANGTVVTFPDDSLRHFVPPRTNHQLVAFKSFAEGHPDFGYEAETMRDPAKIKYNHRVHLNLTMKKNGQKLDCVTCHKPGNQGEFMEPITFQEHCSDCHSLHFSVEFPELQIPHRQPEMVKNELSDGRLLTARILDYAIRYKGITAPQEQAQFVQEQFNKINRIGGSAGLLNSVFLTGEPKIEPGTPKRDQVFPACAKCHVGVAYPNGPAKEWIQPTNMANRWLTRGPFTHARHTHLDCRECHGAEESTLTTDILLPSRASCAECHRPLDANPPEIPPANSPEYPGLAAVQRAQGGVRFQCQVCHGGFHTDQFAADTLKEFKMIPNHIQAVPLPAPESTP